ncbi:MAG: hypothetical protein EHM35_01875 [Planctomycetaceae bacterium]|nr:MAG: hypothetical protein EHM35_01875 [Planctomycetaceae bacterium]
MQIDRMNWVFTLAVSIVVFSPVGAGAQTPEDGTKKLTVHRVGQTAGAAELRLLSKSEELTDADAFPLYEKAVNSVPKELDWSKIKAWRETPVNQLPKEEVGAVLRSFEPILPLLEQAGKCKRCDWPVSVEGDSSFNLSACRNMVFLLALKARSELARGDCASCVRTLGTGLALAKHLSTAPTVVHVLVGVAISAVICGEIEQYVQQPGTPSLEAALAAIPKPLFDENHSELYGMDQDGRSRVQLLFVRANRHVIALQYIEALRLSATKTGKWPSTLDEFRATLPTDPVSGKPFSYKRVSDAQAILEGPLPKGGDLKKDTVRYELTMGK